MSDNQYDLRDVRPASRHSGGRAMASKFAHVIDGRRYTPSELTDLLGCTASTLRRRVAGLARRGVPLSLTALGLEVRHG